MEKVLEELNEKKEELKSLIDKCDFDKEKLNIIIKAMEFGFQCRESSSQYIRDKCYSEGKNCLDQYQELKDYLAYSFD